MTMRQQPSSTFEKLADLPLEIESCSLVGLTKDVSSGFVRATTVVRLHGGGEEGVGEDVIYDPAEHVAFQRAGAPELAGSWTLAELGAHVDALDLFGSKPFYAAFRAWRRWAFHSAALDLALRQSGRALHDVLGIQPRPVAFVVSRRLGEPASTTGLLELLHRYPGLRLKLDATDTWDQPLIDELAALDALETVDFKGFSPDGDGAYPSNASLYKRVAETLPHVWLEDPRLGSTEADAALAPYMDRITWDLPVRSVADIQELAPVPLMINVKPSRFGSLRELFAVYDFCAEHGIGVYAGGQFELGPGRGQVQCLASLFHARAPNDIAPASYNDTIPVDGLPASPLPAAPTATGFGWDR
jgi:L-alanine-DL-glutamate epimerase-like enolase superfamily enzyme